MSERVVLPRRRALRLLAATPLALAGCGEAVRALDAGVAAPDAGAGGADAAVCRPSGRDALGPFFEEGSPMRMVIAAPDEAGERLLVEGSLLDAADCARPLAGYVIDVWQADVDGNYHAAGASGHRLRGRIATGADGRFALETIKPGFYETGAGPRPAHLHLRVYAPDGGDRLVTQVYFAGDAFLGAADSCGPPTCFSNDPDRIMTLEPARVGGRDGLRGALRLVVAA